MKKTLIVAACAAIISTGAMAKPESHHAPKPHNDHQIVQTSHHKPSHHMNHHKPAHHTTVVHVAHARPTPPPPPHHHHHHHNSFDFGDALIAFAILASAF